VRALLFKSKFSNIIKITINLLDKNILHGYEFLIAGGFASFTGVNQIHGLLSVPHFIQVNNIQNLKNERSTIGFSEYHEHIFGN
jgi:hypothetical protein